MRNNKHLVLSGDFIFSVIHTHTHTQEQHVPLGGESWEQRTNGRRKRRALAALVGV